RRGPVDVPLPLDLDPSAPEAVDLGPSRCAATGRPEPLPKALADELTCVAAWLDREAAKVRLVHCDGGLASAFPALPSFAAR
ncbi:MAG TPA: hypothetical protein VGM93_04830, partial [Acidimicrobiales bacterium]